MRRILVVAGASPVFGHLAAELQGNLPDTVRVFMARENSAGKLGQVALYRIRKVGFWSALDQLFMRAVDLFFLRRKVEKTFHGTSPTLDLEDSSINSGVFRDFIKANEIDIVVCLGTSIVSRDLLNCPKLGAINLHPGYLPKYRGLGNFWAVVNGDWDHVGVSCHWIDEGIDTGQLIWRNRLGEIPPSYWELNMAAFNRGIEFLAGNLGQLIRKPEVTSTDLYRAYSWFGVRDYVRFLRQMRVRGGRGATF